MAENKWVTGVQTTIRSEWWAPTCNWSLGPPLRSHSKFVSPSLIGVSRQPQPRHPPPSLPDENREHLFFLGGGGRLFAFLFCFLLFFWGGLTAIFGGAKGHLWKIHVPLVFSCWGLNGKNWYKLCVYLTIGWCWDTRLESLPNQTFNVWYIYLYGCFQK